MTAIPKECWPQPAVKVHFLEMCISYCEQLKPTETTNFRKFLSFGQIFLAIFKQENCHIVMLLLRECRSSDKVKLTVWFVEISVSIMRD